MKLSVLKVFSVLSLVALGAVGVSVPLGLIEIPPSGSAPVLFYFSLIFMLLTLTLSRLGIFFAALVRDRAGRTPGAPRYVSGITDRFVWPSATLLASGYALFVASFVVQAT
ncbi:MAG: hypothetical protein WA990_02670 [Rubrobacteraceae bacterium]